MTLHEAAMCPRHSYRKESDWMVITCPPPLPSIRIQAFASAVFHAQDTLPTILGSFLGDTCCSLDQVRAFLTSPYAYLSSWWWQRRPLSGLNPHLVASLLCDLCGDLVVSLSFSSVKPRSLQWRECNEGAWLVPASSEAGRQPTGDR